MQITKLHKIIISIIVVVLLFGIYLYFDSKSKSNKNVDPNLVSTTTSTGIGNIKIDTQGSGYKIEPIQIDEGGGIPKPIPDLNRPVVFDSSINLTPEAKAATAVKIVNLQTTLKKNPLDFDAWINLGIYQKMSGDYAGSVISWKYASRIAPNDYISLGNLGNLYAYYLKDNGQAEVYYKEAISKGPNQASLYVQLAEVYRDVFKDTDKAKAIVAQGLIKIPTDPSLLQIQSSLK
jgi:tetratricopeptide (TPR) repeat protein